MTPQKHSSNRKRGNEEEKVIEQNLTTGINLFSVEDEEDFK
jgi:hypothetical protein